MADAVQVTVNGVAVGLLYALLLVGILIIFHVSKVVNFAHGQFGMLGGLGSLFLLLTVGIPLWLSIVLSLIAVAGTAVFVERLVRRLPATSEGADMILTLGVFLALSALAENVLQRGAPRRYPTLMGRSFKVLGAFIDGNTVVGLVIAVLLFAALLYLLRRTVLGLVVRASAEDPATAQTLGWNVQQIRTMTWAVAGVLAGVGGIFIAARIPVDSAYTTNALIMAFTAGILGGLHRFTAPLLAAIGLGLFENWFGFLVGEQYRTPGVFGLVLVVLVLAPKRFLAGREEARA